MVSIIFNLPLRGGTYIQWWWMCTECHYNSAQNPRKEGKVGYKLITHPPPILCSLYTQITTRRHVDVTFVVCALAFDVCSWLELCTIWETGISYFDEIAIRSERSQESQYLQNILQTNRRKDRWTLPVFFFNFLQKVFLTLVTSGFG